MTRARDVLDEGLVGDRPLAQAALDAAAELAEVERLVLDGPVEGWPCPA